METVNHLGHGPRGSGQRGGQRNRADVKPAAWTAKLWELRVREAPIRRSVSNDRQDMPPLSKSESLLQGLPVREGQEGMRNGIAGASGGAGGKISCTIRSALIIEF